MQKIDEADVWFCGPTRTYKHVCFCAAIGEQADIERA
jgi:hypothetical protein